MGRPGLYEVLEWFPSQAERQRLLAMLAKLKLFEQGKLKKNGSMAKLSVGRRRRFAQKDNERASYLSA
ncbi:hypothetical protein [Pseudomonas sp. DWP1b1]|uniref:hypothetical protein n=1 Tax=unclassified Pseudomonas TaxID=196821 RepID=UPI003CF356F8